MSNVENKIIDSKFEYERPWFYNNKLSIRCELGIGQEEEYLINAEKRANEIACILFENGVDCFFFNHSYYDYDVDDCVKITKRHIRTIINNEKENLKFCLSMQNRYKHHTVRNIKITKDEDFFETPILENRIICYPNKNFILREFVSQRINDYINPIIHFVSYSNECIFSIYDDRGCDVVFLLK